MTDATERLYRRVYHLPGQIGRTFDKLERLLSEADELRILDVVTWRERTDELRSRFLTEPELVSEEWESAVREARG